MNINQSVLPFVFIVARGGTNENEMIFYYILYDIYYIHICDIYHADLLSFRLLKCNIHIHVVRIYIVCE